MNRLPRLLIALVAAIMAAVAPVAQAQPSGSPPLQVEGKTFEGRTFQLSGLKGKVVLVMFWSTGCAVCRDKMHELRANHEGWKGRPFELVLVSMDRRMEDVSAYEAVIASTVPRAQRFIQLWAGDTAYRDTVGKPPALPYTLILDKAGRVVERYAGRIPPEAWDRIAELL